MIVEKIQVQRNKHPEKDLKEFLVKARYELTNKGVPDDYVEKIINSIK